MRQGADSDAAALVAALRAKGARLVVDGGELRVSAPKGVVSEAVAVQIRANKASIIDVLAAEQHPSVASIPKLDRAGEMELGFVQQRMWSHEQLIPETVLYQLPAAWRIHGPLDVGALERALEALIARHEVLRTRFRVRDGVPMQFFEPPGSFSLRVESMDGAGDDPLLRDIELRRRIHALRDTQMDLGAGEVFRTTLFRINDEEHVFFFMPHHLVWDGWSFDIFLRDLKALYEAETAGNSPALPPLKVQYADYADWHRRWMASEYLQHEIDFWLDALQSPPEPLALPADRPRPQLFSHEGDRVTFELPQSVIEMTRKVAAQAGCSHFNVFFAAWAGFVSRLTGQRDIIVGAPVQARHQPELADLIGCFVNTMCLRARVAPGDTFIDLAARSRDFFLDAYERQDAPVDLLADRLIERRDPSRTPLFQTLFTHQQVSRRPKTLGPLRLEQYYINPGACPTELMLGVMEVDDGAHCEIIFSDALFSKALVRRLTSCFEVFLSAALRSPDTPVARLQLLDEDERALTLVTLNATETPYKTARTALAAFEDSVKAAPDGMALISDDAPMTYRELDARSNQFAHSFAAAGASPTEIVGILMNRSADMVAAMLGAWKCGAAYLPLDPAFPEERLRYMVRDSGAKVVVCSDGAARLVEGDARALIDLGSRDNPVDAAPADGAGRSGANGERAYVIYTSGSTGRPKGVENSHRALTNFLESMAARPGMKAGQRLLAVTTASFDISILELFLPLAVGGTAVIASEDDVLDGERLDALLENHAVDVMQATPAAWRMMLDGGWRGRPSLTALCGGEALPPALASALIPKVGALWNMYGPTETTIWSTCALIQSAAEISVGQPIANTQAYILDAAMQPLPAGVEGELWIGGDGVAIGYLGLPELTRERFRENPFRPGERMYCTGDRARRRPDGTIEIGGRRDDQVKLRGYRIELGEIEAALAAHECIADSAAAIHPDTNGESALVGYVVPLPGEAPTGSELRRWLKQSLPQYMTPQYFVTLDKLPRTANRKLDRKALPPPAGAATGAAVRTPPAPGRESAIAAIWREILGVEDIAAADNFFELGGQSLQVARMTARVRERLGVAISPRAVIFESLEQLAAGASDADAA